MRFLIRLLPLLCLLALPLRATTVEEEVKAADTARVLCTLRSDTDRLSRLLSDSLIYGHADGRVQTKEVLLAAVRTNRIKYEAYDYQETKITKVTDDVAIMTGHAQLKASMGAEHVAFALRFLSVWRKEDGVWRLFAYQSSRLSEPTVVPAAK
jgi:hypothetical protein